MSAPKSDRPVTLITGSRKGIGRFLAERFVAHGHVVFGCSRKEPDWALPDYHHVCLDVADEKAMQEVIARIEARFGCIHGVIHAAGCTNPETFVPIRELDAGICERQFRPKVSGSMVLERLLEGRRLDFCLLTSSLASVLGGLGFGAYAAANVFMDSLVQRHNQSSATPWISVNWEGWLLGEISDTQSRLGATVARMAMTPIEAVEVFQRALSLRGVGQLVISSGASAGID